MIIYRITTPHRADDLTGTGAKLYGGRWNSPGNPVIYCAENVSLAMLEKLVHADGENLKGPYALTCFKVPDKMVSQQITTDQLPDDWRKIPFGSASIQHGDSWLLEKTSAVLKVPSAVNPLENNYLLNPSHAHFNKLSIISIQPISFDLRLM